MKHWRKLVVGIGLALLTAMPSPLFARRHFALAGFEPSSSADVPRVSTEKSGSFPTSDGLRLRLDTDLGDIRIFTDASRQVSYRVIVEADSRNPDAQSVLRGFSLAAKQSASGIALNGYAARRTLRGQIWVSYEVHIPSRYSLEVNTHDGDITVKDIDGRITLVTAGGNITVGRVSPGGASPRPAADASGNEAARLDTQGGHITVGDVTGDLRATTAGGRITAGNVSGKAILHTGGGYIHAGRIAGIATLDTGGGNIRVQSAGSNVTATTGGGQIDFGEASGAIRAHTGGGTIHIERVTGAGDVEASGGSVFLRQVDLQADEPLRVSSEAGNITAWFTGAAAPGSANASGSIHKIHGASQLTSGDGDVIVYLPRELAITIDAVIERDGGERDEEHRIVADPSLPLRVSYQDSGSGVRAIHCEASLNGGGEVLHLKAVSGNIFLRSSEPDSGTNVFRLPPGLLVSPETPAAPSWNPGEIDAANDDAEGFFEEIRRMFQTSWWGVVPVDADEMQKRLAHSVIPVYPEVAREAGVEGDVVLRAYVSSDGRIANLKVLAGQPVLARAAVEAVQQWRYRPVMMNGRPTSVVTTLTIAFRLR